MDKDQAGRKRAASTIACRWYAQGNCMRGDSCWFKHEDDPEGAPSGSSKAAGSSSKAKASGSTNASASGKGKEASVVDAESKPQCGICLDEEPPDTYALLNSCSHAFCLDCVKSWRAQRGELQGSEVVKQCPLCRQRSWFFVPSPRFAKDGPEKDRIIANYKARMAAIPCRNFQRSLEQASGEPWCRFGDECFYAHSLTPGGERVKVSRTDPNPRPSRRHGSRRAANIYDDDDFGGGGGGDGGYRAFRQSNGLSTVIYNGEVYEDQLPDSDDEYPAGMAPFGAGRDRGREGQDAHEILLARMMALFGAM